MKTYTSILFFCLFAAGSVSSCKKGSSSQSCMLTSVTDSTATTLSAKQFTYDNSGRLTQIIVTGQGARNKAYTYVGNMIVINTTNNTNTVVEIDSVVLNSFNNVQNYVSVFPLSDTTESGTYTYDANEIVVSSTESVNGAVQDTDTYNTTNGDLNYKLQKGETVPVENYTYYTQNIPDGDPTNIKQLLYYGAYYYRNVHMLSEFYSIGVFYNRYQYTFDGNRIAQVVSRQWKQGFADTVTHVMQYSYSCK